MTEPQVVLKGEAHQSAADQAEEQELLTSGRFDALVLETNATAPDPQTLGERVFCAIIGFWSFLVMDRLYEDRDELDTLARANGLAVTYTRQQNAEIWREGTLGAKLAFTFSWLLAGPLVLLATRAWCPVRRAVAVHRQLRDHASTLSTEYFRFLNHPKRNRMMADQLIEAHQDHGSVLMIVGDCHTHAIRARLDALGIEYEYRGPQDNSLHVRMMKLVCPIREGLQEYRP
ncbi:MAG: hypothetical protein U5K37_11550 [Natrialbaceae archaeon]|nr:hypothetical protein [Natrialbaceae archaeon]